MCILWYFALTLGAFADIFMISCGSLYTLASKETYNFLEWCPLKSTSSKWMIFGLMLATVLLITHVKKQRNRNCRKWDKCLQITTSPFSEKNHRTCSLSTVQTFEHSIAIHSNSIRTFTIRFSNTYLNGSRYWIWMNSYWNVRKSVRWKLEQLLWFLKLDLLWFEGIYLIFWHIRFLCFLTWVMRRTS